MHLADGVVPTELPGVTTGQPTPPAPVVSATPCVAGASAEPAIPELASNSPPETTITTSKSSTLKLGKFATIRLHFLAVSRHFVAVSHAFTASSFAVRLSTDEWVEVDDDGNLNAVAVEQLAANNETTPSVTEPVSLSLEGATTQEPENDDELDIELFEGDRQLQASLQEIEVEVWENERNAFGRWYPCRPPVDRPNWSNASGEPSTSKEEMQPQDRYKWTACQFEAGISWPCLTFPFYCSIGPMGRRQVLQTYRPAWLEIRSEFFRTLV
jgi:hypothetical protein